MGDPWHCWPCRQCTDLPLATGSGATVRLILLIVYVSLSSSRVQFECRCHMWLVARADWLVTLLYACCCSSIAMCSLIRCILASCHSITVVVAITRPSYESRKTEKSLCIWLAMGSRGKTEFRMESPGKCGNKHACREKACVKTPRGTNEKKWKFRSMGITRGHVTQFWNFQNFH